MIDPMAPRLRRWQVLEALVKAHGWTSLAELGVFEGKTARHLLASCRDLHWIGVDHWQPGDPAKDVPEQRKKRKGDTGYRSYARFPLRQYRDGVMALAAKYAPRATVHEMTTAEAALLAEDGSLDAVFIDADHSEAGVEADIRAWAPKVRPGGMVLGHDHDMPSVARAIDRLCPGYTKHADSVWSIAVEEVRV